LAADRIPKKNIPATEASLLKKFEIQPHTIREIRLPAADERRADPYMELVDNPCLDRLTGEFRP
jgi:hypothetical protein